MKVTLVSTLPFPLKEDKPGLIPATYRVPAAKHNEFSFIHISDGYHLMLVPFADEDMPPMKIPDQGEVIANAIIVDYTAACICISFDPRANGEQAVPGLFFVEGHLYPEDIKKRHADELAKAFLNTNFWFERLVKMADDDWAKTHQHKSIADSQRAACNYLNLQREWNFTVMDTLKNLCWACKQSVHPDAIICSNCKAVINEVAYKEAKGKFANA